MKWYRGSSILELLLFFAIKTISFIGINLKGENTMKLVPCEINEVNIRRPVTNWLEVFEEFDKSGRNCVEITDYPHKTAKNCCTSARAAIKHYRLNTLYVYRKGVRVFLTNVKLYK